MLNIYKEGRIYIGGHGGRAGIDEEGDGTKKKIGSINYIRQ